ncbi:MAG: TOBE domain-containing protein [Steroidobacteraceae bacterium]
MIQSVYGERIQPFRQRALGGRELMSLLPVRTAAERLGVSYSTLKQWIYKGTIRTVRTGGGHHRVAESEIDRMLAAGGRLPKAAKASKAPAGVIVAISGRNQLRGIVDEIRVDGLLAQVRLRIGDQRLTAVITRDAVDELKLKRGGTAIAIIKSTEVMIALEQRTQGKWQREKGKS